MKPLLSLNRCLWVLTVTIAVGLAVLYASEMPSRLTGADFGGDGGDFLAAALTHGVPHPSGYPTYTVLGTLVQKIPWGTPVQRGVLLSLIPAALAVGLLSRWVGVVLSETGLGWKSLVGALVTGLAAGTAPILWSQAVIVEVHGLQALLITLTFLWMDLLTQAPLGKESHWKAALLAWTFGLGLGNHLTLVLVVPALAVLELRSLRLGWRWGDLALQVCAALLGLGVYLYLPLAARAYPPVNWGNPQTWAGFTWLVSGAPYQGLLFHAPLIKWADRVSAWARIWLEQVSLIGVFLAGIGSMSLPRSRRDMGFTLGWIFFAFSIFSMGYNTVDSNLYLIPAGLMFAAWLGLGVGQVINFHWKWLPIGTLMTVSLLGFLLVKIPQSYHQVDPRTDMKAADFAEDYLNNVPKDSLLIASTDADIFSLWYYHDGLGWRPDVHVVALPLTQFVWYQQTLAHNEPGLNLPSVDDRDPRNSAWGDAIPALNLDLSVCRSQWDSVMMSKLVFTCTGPTE